MTTINRLISLLINFIIDYNHNHNNATQSKINYVFVIMYFLVIYFLISYSVCLCSFYASFSRRFFELMKIDFNKRIEQRFSFVNDDDDDNNDDDEITFEILVVFVNVSINVVMTSIMLFRDLSRVIDFSKKRRFVD